MYKNLKILIPSNFSSIVFVAAFVFFLVHPFGNVFYMIGDNIAQIAYWHILFNPHLAGSFGGVTPKPALMFLLGFSYDLSLWIFGSGVLIKGLLAFFAALLTTATARLSADVAGKMAGVLAAVFLVSLTPVTGLFADGSSMIFFLPLLLIGLRFWAIGRENLGIVIVGGATLIRPEGLGVLIWLALFQQLIRRRLRPFFLTVVVALVIFSLYFFVQYLLYGNWNPVEAFGPQAGYVFIHESTLLMRLVRTAHYIYDAMLTIFVDSPGLIYLFLPAMVTLISFGQRRTYLSILGIVLFLMVYFSLGVGEFLERFFQFLIPLIAAFGWAGLLLTYLFLVKRTRRYFWINRMIQLSCQVLLLVVLIIMIKSETDSLKVWQEYISQGDVNYAVYTQDANRLLMTQSIPKDSRVLLESDMVYGVLVRDINYFRDITSLQFFNLKNDIERQKILQDIDYILISKTYYQYYYLWYNPLKLGNTDTFRRTISEIMMDAKSKSIYNYSLTPVENSVFWLILRVEPFSYNSGNE